MKHIFFLILLLFSCFDVFSQTAITSTSNPTRTVLYTCGTNEDFYEYEYFSNMKVVGNKFACITQNQTNKKLTFVLNGEKVITAPELEIFWVDLTHKDKCIYTYENEDKEDYIIIDGHKYGPYEDLAYRIHSSPYNWDGTPNLGLTYNKNSFIFKRMGKLYRHDNDGSIYECKGDNPWWAEEDEPIFTNTSGSHSAHFSMNFRLLTIGSNNYVMPIDVDAINESISIRDFYITDDGACIVSLVYQVNNGPWKYPYLFIYNNIVQNIADDEYFDPVTHTIKTITNNIPKRPSRQFESIQRWRDGKWQNSIEISLQDKANRHFFTANWNYEYVMIDDKKYGKATPINAFYDETNNSFGWVCIEGKQLVLYSYKL